MGEAYDFTRRVGVEQAWVKYGGKASRIIILLEYGEQVYYLLVLRTY